MLIPVGDEFEKRSWPVATTLILTFTVLCHVLCWLGPNNGYTGADVVAGYDNAIVATVTSCFVHAGWMHLAANMAFLLALAPLVEDRLGVICFLVVYASCALAAGLCQAYSEPSAMTVIGASGAVAGVAGCHVALSPRGTVRAINPIWPLWLLGKFIVRLPAWIVVGVFFVANLIAALGGSGFEQPGVAIVSHLGGLAAGLVLGLAIRH